MMFGVQAAREGGSRPVLPMAMNTLITSQYREGNDDPEADAVEGAATAGGDAEGNGEQRHHERDERKCDTSAGARPPAAGS